jgi:hypothetical protein
MKKKKNQNSPTSSRKVKLPAGSYINKTLLNELDSLLGFVSPEELSRHLRQVFMVYVHHEHELLPPDFDRMTDNFYFLFEFLDAAEREKKMLDSR